MAIITLDTISGYWKDVSDWVRGLYKPLFQKFGRQQLILTTIPLGISGTYTSQIFDTLSTPQINFVSVHAFSDQDGMLYLDASMDGTNWNIVQNSMPLSASTPTITYWQQPLDRYFRVRYVNNNTTAQTVFRLSVTMHD